MAEAERQARALILLYADISGSTRMYEQYGDRVARTATGHCLDLASQVVRRFDGEPFKTVGDAVLCVFEDAALALDAAREVQNAVAEADRAGEFQATPMRLKVVIHSGSGVIDADREEIFGEAHLSADYLLHVAKASQILATSQLLSIAPRYSHGDLRSLGEVRVPGREGSLNVHELVWDTEGLTQVSAPTVARTEFRRVSLEVHYSGRLHVIDEQHPLLTLGRVAGNDVVVPSHFVSRRHAEIVCRNGTFVLRDVSANGTFVEGPNGQHIMLRRNEHMLDGRGTFCLGGTPADNPRGLVEFGVRSQAS